MLKALVGLPITVKGVLTRIPSDCQWYFTMMKVSTSIVKESNGMKCHSIKQKFANKSRSLVKFVKKNLPV